LNLSPTCDSGEVLVGGGFSFDTSSPAVLVRSYYGSPSQWLLLFITPGTTPQTVNGYAACLSHVPAQSSYSTSHVVHIAPGAAGVAQANCPAGTLLAGGGFWSSDSGVSVYDLHVSGANWQASFLSTTTTDVMVTAAPTCLHIP
jgi:hypothetical protein